MTLTYSGSMAAAAMAFALGTVMSSAAFAVTGAAPASSATTTPASVLVFDQKVQGDSVSVSYAFLPSNGYIVIKTWDKDAARAQDVLGYVELKAGDHRNIKTKLGSAPATGSLLTAAIYLDADGKPGFDRAADKFLFGDSMPAESRFMVQ